MVSTERKVRKVVNHGEYVEVPFETLVCGDVFSLYEPDGTGLGRFKASSNAYLNTDNIWEVEIGDGKNC